MYEIFLKWDFFFNIVIEIYLLLENIKIMKVNKEINLKINIFFL